MKREDLISKVAALKAEIKEVLQLVFDSLNKGQQKKILKKDTVKALFDRYGVKY